jgi:N-acetylmuramoyl-L-alanine amidase
MDLRLLSCSCLTVASFSFLVLDYLTYTPTSAEQISSVAEISANAPLTLRQTPRLIAQKSASESTVVLAVQQLIAEKPTPRLSHFAYPSFTGFLSPSGFSRPNWKAQTSGLAITKTPFETQRFVVLLDPGHGGTDPGATSHNGLIEKHLTLDIAKRTRLYLSKYPNIDVIFTRETDRGLSRDSRVNKIKNSRADLMISLHFNDLPQTDIALVETYYAGRRNIQESLAKQHKDGTLPRHKKYEDQKDSSNRFSFTHSSKQLATILQQHVFSEVKSKNSNAENAGVKKDTLFVLTRSYKPSALIEITCLSNPAEAMKLTTNEYRNQISSALADAILEYRQSTINSRMIDPGENDSSPSLVQGLPATKHTKKNIGRSV